MNITCVFLVIYPEGKLQPINNKSNNIKLKIISAFLLLLASVVWGAAFVAQSVAGESVGTFSFNGIRFIIGGLCMLPLLPGKGRQGDASQDSSGNTSYYFQNDSCQDYLDDASNDVVIKTNQEEANKKFQGKVSPFNLSDASKNSQGDKSFRISLNRIRGGILCGIALFLASTFQQAGIAAGASAGEAGFITAFYIILVPVLGLFLGKKCSKLVALAVAIAITGLYFLCFDSFGELISSGITVLSFADIMLLGCAFLFSVQILGVDHYAPKMNTVVLSCTQFFTCGVISLICGVIFELIPDPSGWIAALSTFKAWIPILYTGIFSSAVGYTLQIVGQRGLSPAVASLIMSMESVFSTIFGWLILRQIMSGRKLLGCTLVFAAILIAQFPTRSRVDAIKKRKQQ